MGMKKRGIFFSTDALIALSIILLVILISFPVIQYSKNQTKVHKDILLSFSTLKVSESDSTYLQSLINDGIITSTNKTVLEQIGELYVTNLSIAKNLAYSLLSDVDTKENVGIWYGSTLIASKNSTSFENA